MSSVLARRRRHRYETVLELTPLIDVIFLLLIFFMVSTSFVVNKEIPIQLPKSDSATTESTQDYLAIGIDAQGRFSINGSMLAVSSADEIAAALRKKLENKSAAGVPVRIDGHESADYQFVIRAMDACRQAGLTDVRLNTLKSVD
jgi:biopolymer transport protein ExbD